MKSKGFTLIEILITISIFSIVITSFLGLFASVFKEQRKSLASANLLNAASYTTEYMSRALRLAQKDIYGTCISAKGNYENPGGDTTIRFLKYDKQCDCTICQEFLKVDSWAGEPFKILKVRRSTDESDDNLGTPEDVTPSDILIEDLTFQISGNSQTDVFQPKVTVALELRTKGGDPQTLQLQTTVTQRELDVPK